MEPGRIYWLQVSRRIETNMNRRSFRVPSADESRQGYVLALFNARRHLIYAEILNANNQHGVAVAHLVLAGEEAIKILALFLVSEGLAPREAFLRELLTRHAPRQTLGVFMAVGELFVSGWITMITRLNEEFSDHSSDAYVQAREARVQSLHFRAQQNCGCPRGQDRTRASGFVGSCKCSEATGPIC